MAASYQKSYLVSNLFGRYVHIKLAFVGSCLPLKNLEKIIMGTITLKTLTCHSTVNPAGDRITLRVNSGDVTTLDFGRPVTKNLPSYTANDTDLLQLSVKNNVTRADVIIDTKTAVVNPSEISYFRGSGHYTLGYE